MKLKLKKITGTLIDFWYIWLGIVGFMFVLVLTFFQFILIDKLREYKMLAWTRIFVIAIPSLVVFTVISEQVPTLFLNSPLVNYFGENAEEIARYIRSGLSYIGGVLITLFIALWKKKNLPLRRFGFIDKALDKIFGEDMPETNDADDD